ncbi:LAFE_0G00342g1_1 [Lachancea fermentati]|uniref:LAFE_0G00342g1_1 n=1 Tax=Lachancea fermentati TaxID=4955 RepID=A0A1G4MGU7_LACFM|nr:LAFE_0G00342g1_1 [Lachancea fermentati]
MDQLQDTAKRLLVRSQEAILQLDLCIQRQQRLYECGFCEQVSPQSGSSQTPLQEYHAYLAQLNSLYIRTQHLRDKIQKDECPHHAIGQDSIHQLLSEYQTIINKLNEFTIQKLNNESSPVSDSSRSTVSFKPRPLKILTRNNVDHSSPSKKPKKTTVTHSLEDNHVTFSTKDIHSHNRSSSLPGSPKISLQLDNLGHAPIRPLRGAKSCNIGLNKSKPLEDNRLSFFKDRQRFSLSFFDDEYSSDEETVISVSPPLHFDRGLESLSKVEPLRRYKSHESMLSLSKEAGTLATSRPTPFTQFLCRASCQPSTGITSIAPHQIHSFQIPSSDDKKRNSSKDLLSKIVENTSKKQTNTWLGGLENRRNPIMNAWKRFNHQTLITSEVGIKETKRDCPGVKRIIPRGKRPEIRSQNTNSCSTLVIGPNGSKFVTQMKEPELSYKISQDALNEALNTDFKFDFT